MKTNFHLSEDDDADSIFQKCFDKAIAMMTEDVGLEVVEEVMPIMVHIHREMEQYEARKALLALGAVVQMAVWQQELMTVVDTMCQTTTLADLTKKLDDEQDFLAN